MQFKPAKINLYLNPHQKRSKSLHGSYVDFAIVHIFTFFDNEKLASLMCLN